MKATSSRSASAASRAKSVAGRSAQLVFVFIQGLFYSGGSFQGDLAFAGGASGDQGQSYFVHGVD